MPPRCILIAPINPDGASLAGYTLYTARERKREQARTRWLSSGRKHAGRASITPTTFPEYNQASARADTSSVRRGPFFARRYSFILGDGSRRRALLLPSEFWRAAAGFVYCCEEERARSVDDEIARRDMISAAQRKRCAPQIRIIAIPNEERYKSSAAVCVCAARGYLGIWLINEYNRCYFGESMYTQFWRKNRFILFYEFTSCGEFYIRCKD